MRSPHHRGHHLLIEAAAQLETRHKTTHASHYRIAGPATDPCLGRPTTGSVCGDGSVRRVAEVDDAEAIAVRVREHDEVRVVGVAVPADSFCPEGHEARCLGCLLGRTGYM